jgi:putative ABC transport system permease protein
MFVYLERGWLDAVTIRLRKTRNLQASVNNVKSIFEKYAPAYPFDFDFADVEFQTKFTTINLTGQLASLFATLAIIITGLGLFGLAAFTTEQRTKEIGIRKVLGASVPGLVTLISREFLELVLVSFFLSAPVAGWLLSKYLERYAIHAELGVWVFPAAGLIAVFITLAIVVTQAFRIANTNPVNSLKSE